MAKKNKKKGPKSTERHAFGLTILRGSHPRVRALKQDHEPEIHGNKLWNSSYLIMDYLQRQGLPAGSRVMEVGCGWGLAGIYCARRFAAEVTGIDADPNVFAYLRLHAEINEVEVQVQAARFEDLTKRQLADQDLVLGADICFWDELVDPVYKLVRRAVRAGAGQIIIADPGRPPFDEVCSRCVGELGGEVKEWSVDEPRAHGWLLIVGSLPIRA
ncbi:MAG: methyltransferase domain-containing protein [Gemmatimonadota bacterium]